MTVAGDEKSTLRRRLLAERNALPSDWRAQASAAAWRHLLAWRPAAPNEAWGLYAALGSEMETDGLAALVRQAGARVLYPKAHPATGHLSYGEVAQEGELVVGIFGVREPVRADVPVTELDVIVVPGVAFDRAGARLGYGAGYYDRSLPGFGGAVIGLAFAAQVQERLPTLAHDQGVQAVVTEVGVSLRGGA